MLELSTNEVGQLLGIISYILGVSFLYQKDDRKLKILMIIFNINHMIHFLLLGALVSALSSFVSILRTFASMYTSSKYVALVFILVGSMFSLAYVSELTDLFALLGMSVGTYSIFMLQGVLLRIGLLFGSVLWLVNNIFVGSVGGILLESTLIIVNLVTIKRLYGNRVDSQ